MIRTEHLTPKNAGFTDPRDPGEQCYGTEVPRGSISLFEGEFLATLCAAKRVIEVGTGLGISTRYIARTAECVWTIDPDPWVKEVIVPEIGEVNVVALCSWDGVPAHVDVVFIDGCHKPGAVANDLRLASEKLQNCGVIVLHDWRLPDVQKGAALYGASVSPVNTEFGLGLITL